MSSKPRHDLYVITVALSPFCTITTVQYISRRVYVFQHFIFSYKNLKVGKYILIKKSIVNVVELFYSLIIFRHASLFTI